MLPPVLATSSSGRFVRIGRSRILAHFLNTTTGAAVFPAGMEIIHGGYWKVSYRAAIKGYALKGGKANFPNFTIIELGSYELDKKTGDFPDGRSCSRNCSGHAGRVTKTSIITRRRRRQLSCTQAPNAPSATWRALRKTTSCPHIGC